MPTKTPALLSQLRFRHLTLIRELARVGSVRAASDKLNLSQPAVSKTLSQLEELLGFALFERSAHGLTPTAQGKIALRWAEVLLSEAGHFVEEARTQKSETVFLRLGAPAVVAASSVPAVLAALAAKNHSVQVSLVEARTSELLGSLIRGELDVLLTTYNSVAMNAEGAEQLHYEKFREERFVVIAPAKHPLLAMKRVDWAQLTQQQWILPPAASFTRQGIDANFVRAGVRPPSPFIESSSPTTNVRLVAQGLGISIVPAAVCGDAEHLGKIGRIKVTPASLPPPVALVCRPSMVSHPSVCALRDALLRYSKK